MGGDGGCRVGEVRAGTTSPMPDHSNCQRSTHSISKWISRNLALQKFKLHQQFVLWSSVFTKYPQYWTRVCFVCCRFWQFKSSTHTPEQHKQWQRRVWQIATMLSTSLITTSSTTVTPHTTTVLHEPGKLTDHSQIFTDFGSFCSRHWSPPNCLQHHQPWSPLPLGEETPSSRFSLS